MDGAPWNYSALPRESQVKSRYFLDDSAPPRIRVMSWKSRTKTTPHCQLRLQKSRLIRRWLPSNESSHFWTRVRHPAGPTGQLTRWRRSFSNSYSSASRLTSPPIPNWHFLFNARSCTSMGKLSTDLSKIRAMKAWRSNSIRMVFENSHSLNVLRQKISHSCLNRCGTASIPKKVMTTSSRVYGPRTSPLSPWSQLKKSQKPRQARQPVRHLRPERRISFRCLWPG